MEAFRAALAVGMTYLESDDDFNEDGKVTSDK